MKKVISTPNAPAALGPYSQAIEVNGMVFLSGQLPIDPATGEFVPGGIKEQTVQVFKNIEAVLKEANLTLPRWRRKCAGSRGWSRSPLRWG